MTTRTVLLALNQAGKAVATVGLLLLVSALPVCAENENEGKILGGYFEEWSIYYAGYNISNLHQNGVADKLTHPDVCFR